MSFMQTIGSRIVLEGLNKYHSDLGKAERDTREFGDAVDGSSRKAGGSFSRMTTAIGLGALAAAAAVGGIGVASVKLAADFETTMSRIEGLTNTPASAIEGLREGILKMSTELGVSAAELGAGAYFILSSGITDTATAMEVLRLSAKAAASGLGDTQTVANALTGVMNAYQLSAGDAAKVTDTLINIIKLGKGEPAEFADTLSFTVPLAAQMGIEFEELGAILATLTNQNLNAGQAGQYLRGVMAQLLKPSQEAEEAFAALGLPIQDFRELVRNDFVGAMQLLVDKTGGSTEALATLFPNVEGLTAVMAAFANQGEATAANLEAIRNGTGALDTAFAAVQKTANFKLKKAMQSLNVVMIRTGAVILPGLVKGLDKVTPLLEKHLPLAAIYTGKVLKAMGQEIEFVVRVARFVLAPVGAFISVLGSLTRYVGFVVVQGDHMNDWLTHLPTPIRGAVQWLGELGAKVVGLLRPISDLVAPIGTFVANLDAGTLAAQGAALAIGAFLAALVVSKITPFLEPLLTLVGTLGKLAGSVVTFTIQQVTKLVGGAASGVVEGATAAGTELAGEALAIPKSSVLEMDVAHMSVQRMDVNAQPKVELPPDAAKKAEEAGKTLGAKTALGFAQGLGAALAAGFIAGLAGLTIVIAGLVGLPVWAVAAIGVAAVLATALLVGLTVKFGPAILGFFTKDFPALIASGAKASSGFMGDALGAIGNAIAAFFTAENLGKIVGTGLGILLVIIFPPALLVKFRKQIGKVLGVIVPTILNFFTKALPAAIAGIDFAAPFETAFGSLENFFTKALPRIFAIGLTQTGQFVIDLPNQLTQLPGRILNALKGITVKDVVSGIVFAFIGLPAAIVAIFEKLGVDVIAFVTGFAGTVAVLFEGLGGTLLGVVGTFLQSIGNSFLAFFDINGRDVGRWVSATVGFVVGLGGAVVREVGAFLGEVVGFFAVLPGRTLAAMGNLGAFLVQAGRDLINGLLGGVMAIAPALIGFVADLPFAMLRALVTIPGGLVNVLFDVGKQLINGLIRGFTSIRIPAPKLPDFTPGIPIPGVQHGTLSFPGGLAIVGEAGPELTALPRGARVWPHGESMRILDALAGRLPGFQGGMGMDAAFSGLSSILALVQKLLAKIPASLFNSNLQIPSFERGGFVPAGQQLLAQLHGPEAIVPMRGAMTASAPGLVVNISAPVNVTINEMNWARVRSVALAALDEALGSARSTAIRQGVPLSSGIS